MTAFQEAGMTDLARASVAGPEEASMAMFSSGSDNDDAEEAEAALVPSMLYGSRFPVSAA